MKIQLVERGGKYFLRKYWLGFFPVYWDNGWDGGWDFIRSEIDKGTAENLMRCWVLGGKQKARYQLAKDTIVKSVTI